MPFLAINGVTVPIVEASLTDSDIIKDVAMQSGRRRRCRLTTKRTWSFKSGIMPLADAMAMRQLLLSTGQYWGWENDVFSSKGLPSNGAGVVLSSGVAGGTTADGAANPFVPHDGSYNAVVTSGGTGNLLPFNPSFEGENSPSFTTLGNGGYARNTYINASQPALDGTCALRVYAPSNSGSPSNSGIFFFIGKSITGGNTYTFSVYLNTLTGNGTQNIMLFLQDNAGTQSIVQVLVPEKKWTRGVVTITTASNATTITMRMTNYVNNAAFSVICDCAQLEVGNYASRWSPTATVSTPALYYQLSPDDYANAAAVTIATWCRYNPGPSNAAQDTARRPLFHLLSSGLAYGYMVATTPAVAGGLTLSVFKYGATFATATYPLTTSMSAAGWQHVIVQIGQYFDGAAVSNRMACWLNGVQVSNAVLPYAPALSACDTLYWASASDGTVWQEAIDTSLYLPYWAGPAFCQSLAQSPSPYGAPPELVCTGDFGDLGETVSGVAYDVKLAHVTLPADGGVARYATVEFGLSEV